MRPFDKPQFPTLPDKLREDLRTITPSMDGDLTYWPCSARMKDGTVLVCVYVVPEGKSQSDVTDVVPHEGRSGEPVGRPEYYWCLFSD